MLGDFKVCLVLLFLNIGCSQPKYEVIDGEKSEGNKTQEVGVACSARFSASNFCLSWTWEEKPNSAKQGSLVFKVYRNNLYDGTPVLTELPSPAFMLWMPSMGHGSNPSSVSRLDTGTYRASEIFFSMPGKWEMHFQSKNGASILDEAIVEIIL